jgi:tripartite ATP-independent transporter DctM subunit
VALIIIGGIYGGIFTVTEAAGIGTFVLLALFSAVKGFSRESWRILAETLRQTVSLTGLVLLILMTAQIFSRLLVLSGLGSLCADYIISFNLSPMGFVICIMVLYFFLGAIIDSVSVLAITIPIFYPVVESMGLDEVWFAMVMILATQIGNITPPVGLVIYAVKGVAEPDITLEDIIRGVLPFFLMMVVALAIVIAFPDLTTWIPYHVMRR